MKRKSEADRLPQEPTEPDDIEILEIVGMNDVGPAAPEAEEIVVSFDEQPGDQPPAPEGTGSRTAGETADARERLLRLRADFENLKKRIEREREEFYRHATASLVARLLPVLDNFERAFASVGRGDGDTFLQGMGLIQRQLLEELKREGLRPVECVGRSFDPSIHEAVATEANPRLPANTVVEELQRGYYFEDRLLRPALVRVTVPGRPDDGRDTGPKES